MFALVYRWRLHPGREESFAAAWAEMTETIRSDCGSFGSRLHRSDDGTWAAYAVWPDAATFDACSPDNPTAGAAMAAAVQENFEPLRLTVTDDRLAPLNDT